MDTSSTRQRTGSSLENAVVGSVQVGGSDEGDVMQVGTDGDEPSRKKKRARPALSCTECKRRKIKCDRKSPCESCVKRGVMHLCQWEDSAVASPQPFALQMDHLDVAARVARLEELLCRLPAPLLNSILDSAAEYTPKATSSNEYKAKLFPQTNVRRPFNKHGPSSQPTTSSQVENKQTEEDFQEVEKLVLTSRLRSRTPQAHASNFKIQQALQTSIAGSHRSTIFLDPDEYSVKITDLDPLRSENEQVEEILRSFWNVVPSKNVCDWLVWEYFRILHWYFKPMHKLTFLEEYETFWNHLPKNAGNELAFLRSVDPLWLAIFCMVLCLPLDAHVLLGKIPEIFSEQSLDQARHFPKIWFNASQRLMRLGDYSGIPRIRAIQVILLYGSYLQNETENRRDGHRYLIWLSAGIRIACALGLNELGDDPRFMPKADPAYPPGVNSLAREMAKRCWNCLVVLDGMQLTIPNAATADPMRASTDLPMNLDDDDLSPDSINTPMPLHTFTDATLDISRQLVMRHVHYMTEIYRRNEVVGYETILHLDKRFREILETLPECMTIPNKDLETRKPEVGWMRNVINGAANHRILRLHRGFIQRGYTEPQFAYSLKVGLKCARVIIAAHQEARDTPVQYLWFTHHQLLTALVTLYQDTCHMIDIGAPSTEIDGQLQTLSESLESFRSIEMHSLSLSLTVVRRTLDLLEHLDAAIRKRIELKAKGETLQPFQELIKELAGDTHIRDEINTRTTRHNMSTISSSISSTPQPPAVISHNINVPSSRNSQNVPTGDIFQTLVLPELGPQEAKISWGEISGNTPYGNNFQSGIQNGNWNPFPMF